MAHNLIPGNGAHIIGPAVMGIGAVVAHDEVVPFGHGIGGKVRVGSMLDVVLLIALAVHIQVAAANLHRVTGQAHHALDKVGGTAVGIVADHHVKPFGAAGQVIILGDKHDFPVL